MRAGLSRCLSPLHICQRLLMNSSVSHCPSDILDHLFGYFCSCETPLNSLILPAYVCVFISAVTIYCLSMGVFLSNRNPCSIQRGERRFHVVMNCLGSDPIIPNPVLGKLCKRHKLLMSNPVSGRASTPLTASLAQWQNQWKNTCVYVIHYYMHINTVISYNSIIAAHN